MKILSNKKYNDLISKQFRGIFADVNDDNLLRENGLLYGENKELKQDYDILKQKYDILKAFAIKMYDYKGDLPKPLESWSFQTDLDVEFDDVDYATDFEINKKYYKGENK